MNKETWVHTCILDISHIFAHSYIYRYIRFKIGCLHVACKYEKYEHADAVKCRAMKTNEEKLQRHPLPPYVAP